MYLSDDTGDQVINQRFMTFFYLKVHRAAIELSGYFITLNYYLNMHNVML